MIDRNEKFKPTKEEVYKMAKDYWEGLTKDREKVLERLSVLITNKAKVGAFRATQKIKRKDVEYIKEKLEDVGYKFSIIEDPNDKDFVIIEVNFS